MFEIYCNCGLYAIVAGGEERTGISTIRTIWCPQCKVLQDIVTATENAKSGEVSQYPDACEICGSPEVVVWRAGMPCPDCGGQVTLTAGGDVVVSPD